MEYFENIRYISSQSEKAIYVSEILEKKYQINSLQEGDNPTVLLVLGGDGFMLEAVRRFMDKEILLYGINCGNLGFLLNEFNPDNLIDDINNSFKFEPKLLKIDLEFDDQSLKTCYAINDFYLIRKTLKTAHLKIFVDDILRLEKLVGDGVIISTPCGSTAYNASAGGPILPIHSNMIALTPINTFSPRFFKGVIIDNESKIRIEVMENEKRPINACADLQEFSSVKYAEISKEKIKKIKLLFKSKEYLYNKSIISQFS
jgi:NAD+ kinase